GTSWLLAWLVLSPDWTGTRTLYRSDSYSSRRYQLHSVARGDLQAVHATGCGQQLVGAHAPLGERGHRPLQIDAETSSKPRMWGGLPRFVCDLGLRSDEGVCTHPRLQTHGHLDLSHP